MIVLRNVVAIHLGRVRRDWSAPSHLQLALQRAATRDEAGRGKDGEGPVGGAGACVLLVALGYEAAGRAIFLTERRLELFATALILDGQSRVGEGQVDEHDVIG